MRASSYTEDVGGGPDVCFACGERVQHGAMWMGFGAGVWVCRDCAEYRPQPLAALIADAIMDAPATGPPSQRLQEALGRLECHAWRSLAFALERRER